MNLTCLITLVFKFILEKEKKNNKKFLKLYWLRFQPCQDKNLYFTAVPSIGHPSNLSGVCIQLCLRIWIPWHRTGVRKCIPYI